MALCYDVQTHVYRRWFSRLSREKDSSVFVIYKAFANECVNMGTRGCENTQSKVVFFNVMFMPSVPLQSNWCVVNRGKGQQRDPNLRTSSYMQVWYTNTLNLKFTQPSNFRWYNGWICLSNTSRYQGHRYQGHRQEVYNNVWYGVTKSEQPGMRFIEWRITRTQQLEMQTYILLVLKWNVLLSIIHPTTFVGCGIKDESCSRLVLSPCVFVNSYSGTSTNWPTEEPSNWGLPPPPEDFQNKEDSADLSSPVATGSKKRRSNSKVAPALSGGVVGGSGGDGGGDAAPPPPVQPAYFHAASPGPKCSKVMFYLADKEDVLAWRAANPTVKPFVLDKVDLSWKSSKWQHKL